MILLKIEPLEVKLNVVGNYVSNVVTADVMAINSVSIVKKDAEAEANISFGSLINPNQPLEGWNVNWFHPNVRVRLVGEEFNGWAQDDDLIDTVLSKLGAVRATEE